MTYEQLRLAVQAYFGDTRRTPQKTREDLLALADECQMMASTIPTTRHSCPTDRASFDDWRNPCR